MEDSKKKMPKEGIKFALRSNISATLMNDFDHFSNGTMMMSITEATVTENGKELGTIRGGATAPILQVTIGKRSWMVSSEDIFDAVRKADADYMGTR